MLTRRAFLNASTLLAVAGATSAEAVAEAPARREQPPAPRQGATGWQTSRGAALTWAELPLERWRGQQYRALVLSPVPTGTDRVYPGLLLFHGRGESRRVELGLHAWRTRYGLVQSDARARRLPLALTKDERRYIRPEQLLALESALRDDPFAGLVYICPFTPNPHTARSPETLLDGYAEWIEQALLPAARAHAPLASVGAPALGVDGCSLGGFVAAEIFVRKPHLFQTFGVVQSAFGAQRAPGYAEALARALGAGALHGVHLETSTLDPFRGSVDALGQELGRRGARFDSELLPGPHDQAWLRATGTLAMLAWHERVLRHGLASGLPARAERGPTAS